MAIAESPLSNLLPAKEGAKFKIMK